MLVHSYMQAQTCMHAMTWIQDTAGKYLMAKSRACMLVCAHACIYTITHARVPVLVCAHGCVCMHVSKHVCARASTTRQLPAEKPRKIT